ncbi:hypothetical protein TDB9533_04292 [Thalassocella blandensis]|nr:hypothetical protein TDB9533_04292 [Thalassocella blandensis]
MSLMLYIVKLNMLFCAKFIVLSLRSTEPGNSESRKLPMKQAKNAA